MNITDQIKLMALDVVIQTGMRYNDALHFILNAESWVNKICDIVGDDNEALHEIYYFDVDFHRGYAVYCSKMIREGLM